MTAVDNAERPKYNHTMQTPMDAPLRLKNIRQCLRITLFSVALVLVTCAGCATGPEYSKYSMTIKPPAPTDCRIWFYRPSKMFGSAVQPHVFLNGIVVGKSQPGCYFYVDRPPGDYEVKCSTEWASKTVLHVQAGDEKFVRLSIGVGVFVGHIIPSEVERDKGLKEISKCKLITADGANADLREK
jgi:hypothetical protein